MERPSKQKINKETQVLNDTLGEMDLIDIFRTFHPNAEEYTLFSSAHGTFSRIDHILGYKSNHNKFKNIEIISGIFSNHNAVRLDINYRKTKKSVKNRNTWRLNNTLLNNQGITEKNQRGNFKKYLETNNKNIMTQNLWDAATAVLRGKLMTIKSYLKKQETSQINNLTLYLKKLKREEPKPLKVSRRKEIIKIKAEIIEKEMNKTIAKINKTKS